MCAFLCEYALVYSMLRTAWYALNNAFAMWAKEGNAARERTNAPINHARRVETRVLVYTRQCHLTLLIMVP